MNLVGSKIPTIAGNVRLVLGTMTIGPAIGNAHVDGTVNALPAWCQTPPEVARLQLINLIHCPAALVTFGPETGKVMIDTASAYQNGHTELILGEILASDPELRSRISIHTKANSMNLPHRSLSKESVLHQCRTSIKNLRTDSIDIYYLHAPDISVDMEESLDAIEELHASGLIKEFGLSNFPAWKVAATYYRCKERGMVRPTVYQGAYNALTRAIEFEATACFRELGIRSYHYNPLAGGMLTGKYEGIDSQLKETGRFGSASPISGVAYSQRYWKNEIFQAMEVVRTACAAEGIALDQAAIRWLLHHSILSGPHGDGIIFGASSAEHCSRNLAAAAQGPLPATVVAAYDQAWERCRYVSTPYFRNYGTAPGLCDSFMRQHQAFVPNSVL